MSSVPSPLLKLELQTTGENPDSWGDRLNTALVLVENAIAKRLSLTLSSSDVTLTDTSFADSQARSAALDLDGTISANINVIVPSRSKVYLVRNGTAGAFTVTVKTAAGTGVAVTQGQIGFIWCDGTNVVSAVSDASTLGGVAASAYARRDVSNIFAAGEANTPFALTDGATITMDVTAHEVQRVTLGGNRTLAVANEVDGSTFELYVTQDGTGSRTLSFPANFVAGSTLVLSTAANAVDKLVGRYIDALGVWYVEMKKGIQTGGSSTISDITIAGGNVNVDAFALAGQPATAVTFAFTLEDGGSILSASPASPALDFSGFPAGSTITININGVIHGRGGRGGRGAFAGDVSSANLYGDGTAGTAGGDAIRLPSNACTISINIGTNGRVWGGGGGGGGGGASHDGDGSNVGVSGGGGGGGAGGGIAGDGGSIVAANGAPGTDGSVGRLGSNGTGGAAADTGGTGAAATGGAGGDFGAAGATGGTPAAHAMVGAPGTGGAAGKAINYNSGSTPAYTGNTGSPYIKGATS